MEWRLDWRLFNVNWGVLHPRWPLLDGISWGDLGEPLVDNFSRGVLRLGYSLINSGRMWLTSHRAAFRPLGRIPPQLAFAQQVQLP